MKERERNMNKKLVLTSIIISSIIGVVHAEQFPSNGAMQENKTYEKAANYGNMGVYDGSVTATAEYDDVLFQITAGNYLPAKSEIVTTCPIGSYCLGLTNAKYSETTDQGVSACPGGYPNSDRGAKTNTQCYRECTVAEANIAHATSVSGNDYYGTGSDTCAATACDNGYHVKKAVQVAEKTALFGVDASVVGIYGESLSDGEQKKYECMGETCTNNNVISGRFGLTENNTFAAEFSHGVVYGQASCQPSSPIGDYFYSILELVATGAKSIEEFRAEFEPIAGPTKTEIAVLAITGFNEGSLSGDESGPILNYVLQEDAGTEFSTTSTGSSCLCRVTGYTPISEFSEGVSEPQITEASRWQYKGRYSDASECASHCAHACLASMLNTVGSEVRLGMLDAIDVSLSGICEANTIKITWSDAEQSDVDANNAGQCTYDGDIRTPVKAVSKPGKTFKGWRFEKK